MPTHEVEVILMRQLASYLATPIFLVDPAGDLVYYNEPAEEILGRRYQETGPMPASEWATVFTPTDADGLSLPADELPLVIALKEHRAAHRRFHINGLDGRGRQIEVTGIPLLGQEGRLLGALAIFWEIPES